MHRRLPHLVHRKLSEPEPVGAVRAALVVDHAIRAGAYLITVLAFNFSVFGLSYGEWSQPTKLNANINGNPYNHFPYISVDGQRLYFSSRFGGVLEDIYVSSWDSLLDDWGPRQLLPGTVNTLERELSPCESPDGKYLWFTRWNGARGYDVFYSAWDSSLAQWSTATNAGSWINSACNEWSVSISSDNRRMFVAHDIRPGFEGCEGDVLWISYWNDSLAWWDSLIWMGDVVNRSSANTQACMSLDTSIIWVSSGGSWPGVPKLGNSFDIVSFSNNPPLWNAVSNPLQPLNSFEDEWSVGVSSDGHQLYFSSWRDTMANKLEIYVSEWQTGTGVSESESKEPSLIVRSVPNPFNGAITVSVMSAVPSRIDVDVFDILGRVASRLYSGDIPAGNSSLSWNPAGQSSGVYFVRVSTNDHQIVQKVLYMK